MNLFFETFSLQVDDAKPESKSVMTAKCAAMLIGGVGLV